MKTDRILEIIIYLMNHDNVSARYLAERFHVSVRTIQRDMISISAIGVPVYSESGKNGGYSILPTYKIKNSEIRGDEQQMIIKALESLATSYTNDTLKTLIEKYNLIVEKEGGQKVFWDFGVTKENADVQSKNQLFNEEWQKRIGANITDTGNALELDEAISFAKGIHVEALREYMIAVGKNTRCILENLSLEQIKTMVPEAWVMRILEEGGVTTDFRSVWLLVYWGRLTRAGMILTPMTGHHMMHLPPCLNNLPILD